MKFYGFVDLQVNGHKGVDFSSSQLTPEACSEGCHKLLSHGTAAFLPTVVTAHESVYKRNLNILADVVEATEFAGRLPGIHAEGPFLSKVPGARGAHNPDWMRELSVDFFDQMQEWARGHIRMVTIAAELPGAAEFTEKLTNRGIIVSLGHQMAGYEDLKRLVDAGAKAITHLGNGMPNEVNRHHNQLLAGLAEDRLAALFIADGHHVPDYVVKVILKSRKKEQVIFTSDASPVAGCKPGKYEKMGNEAILYENGLFYNPEKECMVGSSSTMLECANWLLKCGICSEEDVVKFGFSNPLSLLGIAEDEIIPVKNVEYDQSVNQFIID